MRRRQFIKALGVTSATLVLRRAMPALGGQGPQVKVSNVRRVFHNGEHNAFTDLVRFEDKFYLTFRSCPDGHMVHPTASIIILSSPDAQQWGLRGPALKLTINAFKGPRNLRGTSRRGAHRELWQEAVCGAHPTGSRRSGPLWFPSGESGL